MCFILSSAIRLRSASLFALAAFVLNSAHLQFKRNGFC